MLSPWFRLVTSAATTEFLGMPYRSHFLHNAPVNIQVSDEESFHRL